MKKILRKLQHRKYVNAYINELRWDCLNTILTASKSQWNNDIVNLLDNNALLIRKYERRRRWLRF